MDLEKLKELWKQLGTIPTNEDGELQEPFLHFQPGTDAIEVWQWFEEQNENFKVNEML